LLQSGFSPNVDDPFLPCGDWCGLRSWRTGGIMGAASPPRSSFPLPTSTLLSSSRSGKPRKGKTPMRVGGWPAEARPRGVAPQSRWCKGKEDSAHGDWTCRRRGDVVARLWPAKPLSAWLEGKRGLCPLGRFPGVHARSDSPSGPAGWAAISSGTSASAAGQVRSSGVEEKVRGGKVRETDGVAPPVIESKGKTRQWA
jgi:hypothetical protein